MRKLRENTHQKTSMSPQKGVISKGYTTFLGDMLVLGGVGETVSIKPMKGDAISGYVVKSIEKCLEKSI